MKDEPLLDLEALVEALDARRRANEQSWRQVAAEIGVSPSTLTRMTQGATPDVDGFGRMVRWLGVPADRFFHEASERTAKKPEDLLGVVSRHLRASKELDAKSAKALERILETAYKQLKGLKT